MKDNENPQLQDDQAGAGAANGENAPQLKDTGIEIHVYVNDKRAGIAYKLTDGSWEAHPEPVETGPWGNRETADEAVRLLAYYTGIGIRVYVKDELVGEAELLADGSCAVHSEPAGGYQKSASADEAVRILVGPSYPGR